MKTINRFVWVLLLMSSAWTGEAPLKLLPPPDGKLYHGVYPGGKTGAEDDLTPADLKVYEQAAGAKAAWVYFSNNWYVSRKFPEKTARWIHETGAVPYIRLMLRSDSKENHAESKYTLEAILKGDFDADLTDWGRAAAAFGSPLMVEWGTECNGEWFPWNGSWNGGSKRDADRKPEGPQRFVATFRHIVETIRKAGASNVSFVFHVNSDDVPDDKWNRLENYWPGADVVDWLAVSVYGPKTPDDDEAVSFRKQMDLVYERVARLDPKLPILVSEFGATAGHKKVSAEHWGSLALDDLLAKRWTRVAGFSWWNERWENGRKKADTTMRLQDTPELAQVFEKKLKEKRAVILERPVYGKP